MTFYQRVLNSPRLPWRVRHPLEVWVEGEVAQRWPGLYRWLRLGRRAAEVRPLTHGPKHHFFGYYDKSPWNKSGCYILAHEADFNDRPPRADDRVVVGVVDTSQRERFEPLAYSLAWNWQQGAMLQWHPGDPEKTVVYNDRREGRLVGVVRHLEQGELSVYERPLYALLPDGRTAFSLNFARLAQHRPGYGYAGVSDPHWEERAPDQDGVWHVDLFSGRSQLIVSLAQLAAQNPKPSMRGAWHYVNHVQPSHTGARIAFFHIWHHDPKRWEVRLYTCRPDGSELTCLLDTGFISHYDWYDDERLLVWANRPDGPARFLLVSHQPDLEYPLNDSRGSYRLFCADTLTEDGHCSFSPDREWVLNDTYPDSYDMRTLMLIGHKSGQRIDIARLKAPKARWWGEIRCDLHPRWSRDGRSVCIDSVHDGTRQMYLIDVERIVS